VAAGCLIAGLALSAFLLADWMHAPGQHTEVALRYLLITGVLSLLSGVAALIIASHFVPNLGLKIALASLFGSIAALINVVVTPLLMFSERSDKYILVITLAYFVLISLGFASIVGVFTTQQIHTLREGVRRLAAGRFGEQVAVAGTDEVADLARSFNEMSVQLSASIERERRLESERRDMIAAVSHDLRTPLATIRAMVEAINDGVVSDEAEVHRYLRLIQHESEHLGRLIEDLFELARIESGNLELRLSSVPLSDLVLETVESLRLTAQEKGVALQTHCDPSVGPLALDGPRMQRVLINLIENAVRHTPAGGTVDVAVERSDGHVRLAVADTGEGIPPEDQPHVFERFYRGDKARSRAAGGNPAAQSAGAGLGLAISRAIVEAHHGTIELESSPGNGTRLIVTLTASGPDKATRAPAPPGPRPGRQRPADDRR
jgi:signal transduction histidine kinase